LPTLLFSAAGKPSSVRAVASRSSSSRELKPLLSSSSVKRAGRVSTATFASEKLSAITAMALGRSTMALAPDLSELSSDTLTAAFYARQFEVFGSTVYRWFVRLYLAL
jgi:hypothetical protein